MKTKILLIDDESILDHTKKKIEGINDQLIVQTETYPEKAIDLLKTNEFNLVVSGSKIKQMDCFEFFNILKERDIDIPFIIFSERCDDELIEKASTLGIDRYILKHDELESNYFTLVDAIEKEIEYRDMEEKLRECEKKYKECFYEVPVALWEEDFSDVKKEIDKLKEEGIKDFEDYLKNNLDVVKELAKKVKIINVNQATLGLYEADNLDDFKDGLARLFKEEYLDEFIGTLVCIAEGRKRFETEKVDQTLKGNDIFIKLKWIAVPDYEDYEKVFVSTSDITELKKTKESYKSKSEELGTIIDTSPIMIFYKDRDGRNIRANEALAKSLGMPLNEIEGKFTSDLFPKEQAEKMDEDDQKVIKTGKSKLNIEERYETTDGTKWSRTSKVPLRNKEGDIIGVIGFAEDITERKKTEEELIKYRNYLEELVKGRTEDLETFTHTITHDLRAPLRAIQGFSNSIIEDYGDELGNKCKEDIERILRAAKKLDELITDLLNYSKISRTEIELSDVDLNIIIEEVIEDLDEKIKSEDVEINIESSIPYVRAHGPTLKQVISNLISNSIKFVGSDVTPKIDIYSEETNNDIKFIIQDNGIGISEKDQEIIFDMFEKLHGEEEYEGTGVGLAIVKKSIEKMGGRVGVDSSLGEGSKFWMELEKV